MPDMDNKNAERLVQTYADMILRICYMYLKHTQDAEDICQDAFIRFYDKDMSFPSMDDAKFWLIRVVKNLSINHVKRKMRESASLEKVMRGPQVNPFKDGASELILKESTAAVRKAVSELPEIYKTVIVLREYAGLNYKEIAGVLKISESNVKVRVHRARKELEAKLDREEVNVP